MPHRRVQLAGCGGVFVSGAAPHPAKRTLIAFLDRRQNKIEVQELLWKYIRQHGICFHPLMPPPMLIPMLPLFTLKMFKYNYSHILFFAKALHVSFSFLSFILMDEMAVSVFYLLS